MATTKDGHAAGGEALAFVCITIIGIGYLFPISAVWAAFDYWKVLFPTANIEFEVTCVYQVGSLLTVICLMLGKSFALRPRIVGGFCGQWLALACIFSFRWLPIEIDVLFWLLLAVVFLCSIATGYLDSAVLALCSQYSPKMQQSLQLGIGLGTFVSVVYRDATKILMPGDIANATSFYFMVALATVVVCLLCYRKLMELPVSMAVVAGDVVKAEDSAGGDKGAPLLEADGEDCTNAAAGGKSDFKSVISIVWFNQLVTFLHFFLTTLCYPGLITSIPCRQWLSLEPEHWFQTLLLTAFTMSDIFGRFFTDEKRRCGLNYKNIWVTLVIRMVIFPLMVYSITVSSAPDAFGFAVVSAFGFLNGFSVSLSLIVMNQIPNMTSDQRKTCGRISACAVNGGLCAGSLAAGVVALALDIH